MKLRRTGSVLVALAAVSWSFAGVLSKSLPWHSVTRNGMRSLFAALLLMGVRRTPRVRLTKGTLLGALGVSLTSLLYMLATQLTTAANAIVLQYAMPVFVIALAMGVCLAAGYALMSLAMDTVSPFSAAILSNIEPILSPVWVFLFLGEAPGALTLVGAGVVLVTATLYSMRGKRG